MKDNISWYAVLAALGVIASSARYIHDIGKFDRAFTLGAWVASSTVGAIVAVFAGHACRAWHLGEDLTYVFVGIAAISSKELIDLIPSLFAKVMKRYAEKPD